MGRNLTVGGITMIRMMGTRTLVALMAILWLAHSALAQNSANPDAAGTARARAENQTDSHVSAEMVKGKLSPATSKPGDEIAVRLNEDVKSNGQVVLKKGSTLKGVVRKVERAESKKSGNKASGSPQSVMELEWIAPGLSTAASQSLNVALQSVVYTSPLYSHQDDSTNNSTFASPRPAAGGRSAGGLGALGVVGGVTSAAGAVAGIGSQETASLGAVTQAQGSLSRPVAILPASTETSTSLQNNFGVTGGNLFHVGSGQAVSSGGTATSMDIFSHMSNDTVITSPSRDFEISSGAQMQLLVQGNAKK
jgi:hypothetical protein